MPSSEEGVMEGLSKFKRTLLRKKLKKEEFKLLADIMEIKRKLKILDKLDEKEKREKG